MKLRLLTFLASLLLVVFECFSVVYTPQTVPNPKNAHSDSFVANPDGILSNAEIDSLDVKLYDLRKQNGVELAVVALDSIEGDDESWFAYELFNHWGIGQKGADNGVLVLFVGSLRAVKIETGYGVEGLLPDAFCNTVLNNYMFPLMKEGKMGAGLIAGVDAISDRLNSEEAQQELAALKIEEAQSDNNMFLNYMIVSFLALLLCANRVRRKTKNIEGLDNNIRVEKMTSALAMSKIFALFFPFTVLIYYLITKKEIKRERLKPFNCPKCGTQMRLLSEKEEDTYLEPGKIKEEDLHSVDHDVWMCENCHETKILPYPKKNSNYIKCQSCGYQTAKKTGDKTIVSATTSSSGTGERTYKCRHCQTEFAVRYTIPKITTSSGSSSGGGYRSSGGGGSWGGGRSGGGGAGGRF